MHDYDLQRLVRELRAETCPPGVMNRVAQRLSRETARTPQSRFPLAWATAGLATLAAVGIWHDQVHRKAHTRVTLELAEKAQLNRARVVQQTEQSLIFVGYALHKALAHSETTISQQAVPPLRNGLQTLKSKLSN